MAMLLRSGAVTGRRSAIIIQLLCSALFWRSRDHRPPPPRRAGGIHRYRYIGRTSRCNGTGKLATARGLRLRRSCGGACHKRCHSVTIYRDCSSRRRSGHGRDAVRPSTARPPLVPRSSRAPRIVPLPEYRPSGQSGGRLLAYRCHRRRQQPPGAR